MATSKVRTIHAKHGRRMALITHDAPKRTPPKEVRNFVRERWVAEKVPLRVTAAGFFKEIGLLGSLDTFSDHVDR